MVTVRLAVEVLDVMVVRGRVGLQLRPVHAEHRHACEVAVLPMRAGARRQVRRPRRHQIEDRTLG